MRTLGACLLGLVALAWGREAAADDVRPASMDVREVARDRFDVRFQVPMVARRPLKARPRLPPGATVVEGSYDRQVAGDSSIVRFSFDLPGGLIGREIGVDGLLTGSRNAILRIRLLDGRDLKAVLGGGRPTYAVEATVDEVREPWTAAPWRAACTGLLHGGLEPAHLLLALALALVAWGGYWIPALGLFLLFDLLGAGLGGLVPRDLVPSPGLAEALVALAACLVAREVLIGRARRVLGLAALAGLAHGVALSAANRAPLEVVGHALGLDLAHLVIGAATLGLLRALGRPRLRRACAWAAGILAVTVAGIAVARPDVAPAQRSAPGLLPMALAADAVPSAGPTAPVAGMQTDLEAYLDVGVFDTRLEVLARLHTLDAWLGVERDTDVVLPVADQPPLLESFAAAILERLTITIDGQVAKPDSVRSGFAVQEATGTYIRDEAVPEPESEALVGISYAIVRPSLPRTVEVTWTDLPPGLDDVRARVIDPEVSREVRIAAVAPRLTWANELREDPLPPVSTVQVRPHPVPFPVASVLLVVLAAVGMLTLIRRRAWTAATALMRVDLALAFLVLPLASWDVSDRLDRRPAPTSTEARAITGALLENLYGAFNVPEEEAVYDRLAMSLTETSRRAAYLENRRALAFARVGGARTHVDVVELRTLEDVAPTTDGGFQAHAAWTVAGSVTHFGHRHLRQNLYRARLTVLPVDGAWKIDTFEIVDLTRER